MVIDVTDVNENAKSMLPEDDVGSLLKISERVSIDIDGWAERKYNDGFRRHMGASVVGHECQRYVWLSFRWIKAERFDGRRLRLFQRGHREENAFVEYLEGIGCEVIQFDPTLSDDIPKDKRQIKVSAAEGHFGGSIDGLVKLPPKYGFDEWILAEFKTSGTGAKFKKLKETGVRDNNYRHFVQMNVYMYLLGLKHALYMSVNKNDDTLHVELIEPEYGLGESTVAVAQNMVFENDPPRVIRKSPAAVPCTYCHFKDVCHKGTAPDKNCRSCKYASAGPNKTWICSQFNAAIPDEFVAKGCDNWWPIINGD